MCGRPELNANAFQDIFLYAVIVPVLPFALEQRVHIAHEDVQYWISILLAVYGGALLVFAAPFGILADRTKSRKIPLLSGLFFLTGATLMLCFGKSIAILIIGRILQGGSAAVVWTIGLALLADTTGDDGVNEVMGIVTIAWSFGVCLAPIFGGIVFDRAGYYAVFGMQFGLLGLDIILRLLLIEKTEARRWMPSHDSVLDDIPASTLRSAEPSKVAVIPDGENRAPLTSVAVSGETPSSTSRRPEMAILLLMKHPRIQAASYGTIALAILTSSFDTTLPLHVNKVFGWSSLGGGLIFLALIVPSFSGPLIGELQLNN